MNEGTFKRYIISKCTKEHGLYHHSNTYASLSGKGIPDSYFDGPVRDLWVEFKYISSMPRDSRVGGVDDKKRGCYSTKQYAWIERRHEAGKNIIGVVGLPDRTAVIQDPFCCRHKSSIASAVPWLDVVTYITRHCKEQG